MALNPLKFAPRMSSLALAFAAPVAALNLADTDRVERLLPRERPGAVARGESGIIEEENAVQLDPNLDLALTGTISSTPEYWPTETTRYRVATLTHGLLPERPQDTAGLIGGISRTSEPGFGRGLGNEYAIGGYYGWKLAPNMTLQGDLQYVNPNDASGLAASDQFVGGINLQIAF